MTVCILKYKRKKHPPATIKNVLISGNAEKHTHTIRGVLKSLIVYLNPEFTYLNIMHIKR